MDKRGLDNAKLIPREIDLTTLDGSGCYGKLSVKAAPLTLDLALYVDSNGDWDYYGCSYSCGIRPALKAPSILFEDSEAGLDLSKIPTDDLLQEIHRRLAEKA